jgi:hypothetical protein
MQVGTANRNTRANAFRDSDFAFVTADIDMLA